MSTAHFCWHFAIEVYNLGIERGQGGLYHEIGKNEPQYYKELHPHWFVKAIEILVDV